MTIAPSQNKMSPFTFETVVQYLRQRAGGLYGGEAITQLEHALQCAMLAMDHGSTPALVTAALLHDFGHLVDDAIDVTQPHEKLAAEILHELFGAAVTKPIRLHVEAKRYLCATDTSYFSTLSPASRQSLVWQGGPLTKANAEEFIRQPYAEDAVRLRLWDDAAKVPGVTTPALDVFIGIMQTVLLPSTHNYAQAT